MQDSLSQRRWCFVSVAFLVHAVYLNYLGTKRPVQALAKVAATLSLEDHSYD